MVRVFTQTYGVVGAIIEKDGKILLVKESVEKGPDAGKWNNPSGWVHVGENPIEEVKREVKEETGFDFTPTHILGIYSIFRKDLIKDFEQIRHPIRVIFIGKINKHQGQFKKEEIAETKWFSPEEIKKMDSNNLRHIDIKTMVKDYFAGKKYPIELLTHTISE